jgi:hypothetical protein
MSWALYLGPSREAMTLEAEAAPWGLRKVGILAAGVRSVTAGAGVLTEVFIAKPCTR